MSDRIKWIDYKGHKILFSDYSGLQEKEYLQEVDAAIELCKEIEPGSLLLNFTDVSNTHTTKKVQMKHREVEAIFNQFQTISAVVGVNGIMKIIAKTFKTNIHFANSKEEAMDYLVAEAIKTEQKQPVV